MPVSTSGAGGASILVSYSGDGNNFVTSTSATLTVTPYASTTTVGCVPSTLTVGQLSTCSATVVGYGPTGIVTWTSTDRNGIFSANPCTLSSASCGITYTPSTSAIITASYSGDQNNQGSSGTFAVTANVNEIVQLSIANSAPPATVTLTGCGVTPSSIPTDGQPHTIQAASGCSPIIVTLPSGGANARYVTPSGGNTLTIAGCTSNPCQSLTATIYYQVLNSYQVTPKNPSSWSTAGTIVVNGTLQGANGQNICSIAVSTGSGQFSCPGWTDYNTPAIMGSLKVSQNERWATSQNSFSDTTGGNQHSSNYYSQVLETFQYSVAGAGTAPSAPALNYSAFGTATTSPLVGSASPTWLDSGSTWTAPAALSGSTVSERWGTSLSSGPATSGATVALVYYHQFQVTFAFTVLGGGSGYTFPSVSFTSFGVATKGVQSWVDAGAAYNSTNPLVGSTAVERWYAQTAAGTVTGAGTIVAYFYHQYACNFGFSVVAGGVYSNPRLSFTALGVDGVSQLTQAPAMVWLDATTRWTVTPLLPSSTESERWISQQTTSGIVSGPLQSQLAYYHQYLGTLSYSIKGAGGSPPVPRINYTTFGSKAATDMPTSPSGFWMDSTSTWYAPLILPGGHGERWLSNVTASLVASNSFRTDAQYTHQFFVQVGASNSAGGTIANTNQWRDQGSTVLLNASAAKLWKFSYWQGITAFSYNGTTRLSNLLVTGPANETAMFFPGLTLTTDDLGSLMYSFGKTTGTIAAGTNGTIYPPPGRNVTVTAVPASVEIMFQGWTGALTTTQLQSQLALGSPDHAALQVSFSIESPGLVHATFATDFNDIRTFSIAGIGVFIAAAYVFIIKRGFAPKIMR